MNDVLHKDTFHGVTRISRRKPYGTSTKKGMYRKTVSSRKAYVNTPIAIAKKLIFISNLIDSNKNMSAYSLTRQLADQVVGRKITSTEYANWIQKR